MSRGWRTPFRIGCRTEVPLRELRVKPAGRGISGTLVTSDDDGVAVLTAAAPSAWLLARTSSTQALSAPSAPDGVQAVACCRSRRRVWGLYRSPSRMPAMGWNSTPPAAGEEVFR
jgi:photosystem II stability/assembly factor-like uncharacterized protein